MNDIVDLVDTTGKRKGISGNTAVGCFAWLKNQKNLEGYNRVMVYGYSVPLWTAPKGWVKLVSSIYPNIKLQHPHPALMLVGCDAKADEVLSLLALLRYPAENYCSKFMNERMMVCQKHSLSPVLSAFLCALPHSPAVGLSPPTRDKDNSFVLRSSGSSHHPVYGPRVSLQDLLWMSGKATLEGGHPNFIKNGGYSYGWSTIWSEKGRAQTSPEGIATQRLNGQDKFLLDVYKLPKGDRATSFEEYIESILTVIPKEKL